MELWLSEHPASGLVAVALIDPTSNPDEQDARSLPAEVRVVDGHTAALVESLAQMVRGTAERHGHPAYFELDALVDGAQRLAVDLTAEG
ncbi:hypothetical protein LQ327_00115 [Actinomycetospora endophytica]|uniref:Uncharacterized protein n=1 Tax=Actinomycetospora endophytica TaxID=2291215 RepID=A0ABS8P2K7_9PSEU|nr:hypothetical protein [Actinomycetospora endophytica]MCD2191795.1 hypothetical protein [Actinomycetospora endophytica]